MLDGTVPARRDKLLGAKQFAREWFDVVSLALVPWPTYLNQFEIVNLVVAWTGSSKENTMPSEYVATCSK